MTGIGFRTSLLLGLTVAACEQPVADAACLPLADYRIVFSADRGTGYDLYSVDADGSNEVRLTDWPGSEFGPRWSPDGTRIAFNADREGGFDVWVIAADGSDPRRITELPGGEWDPDWSPDGQSIAFTYTGDAPTDVFVADLSGSPPRNITESASNDYGPVHSPDGTRFAFLSNRDDADGMANEVYVMSVDGTGAHRVTSNTLRESILAWYPDGQRLAWTQHPWHANPDEVTDGNDEIFSGPADGSAPVNLTNHPAADEHISISRDGCWLVFDSDRRGAAVELYVSPADAFEPVLVGSGIVGLWSSIARIPAVTR